MAKLLTVEEFAAEVLEAAYRPAESMATEVEFIHRALDPLQTSNCGKTIEQAPYPHWSGGGDRLDGGGRERGIALEHATWREVQRMYPSGRAR